MANNPEQLVDLYTMANPSMWTVENQSDAEKFMQDDVFYLGYINSHYTELRII
jgi:hypothetical protein